MTLPPTPLLPIPSTRQLEWHKREFYAFIHFNMNTFTGREWGEGYEDPGQFNPTALDCRQWARVCRDAGMSGMILTAKHHDGFCLWQSQFTSHTVKNSPFRGGEGDVLRELSDACQEFDLKFGLYLSPWDRNHADYGTPQYNEVFKGQLKEVLTSYGELFEFWFDGANGEGPNGKKQVYDWPGFIETVRTHQPNACIFSDGGPDIRWVGNESGFADSTNWSLFLRDEFYPGSPRHAELAQGHKNGTHWVPTECDVSIRPGWFYHEEEDGNVKSVKELMEIWMRSVGQNASLLLNLPVDRRGLVHENEIAALMNFRAAREAKFGIDLALGSPAKASNVRGASPVFAGENVTDGNSETYWATDDDVTAATLEIALKTRSFVSCVLLEEYIPLGQRVEKFVVSVESAKEWKVVFEGTTIGTKRIVEFQPVMTDKVRVEILASRACPTIRRISVY